MKSLRFVKVTKRKGKRLKEQKDEKVKRLKGK
jgi:hypothetical protein